jgi:hypothetical protein
LDRNQLGECYLQYTAIHNINQFIDQALAQFPKLNCGLASVYLQHKLNTGSIIQGRYDEEAHTFLQLPDQTIIDITADQYGGPSVYIGPLCPPWQSDARCLQ